MLLVSSAGHHTWRRYQVGFDIHQLTCSGHCRGKIVHSEFLHCWSSLFLCSSYHPVFTIRVCYSFTRRTSKYMEISSHRIVLSTAAGFSSWPTLVLVRLVKARLKEPSSKVRMNKMFSWQLHSISQAKNLQGSCVLTPFRFLVKQVYTTNAVENLNQWLINNVMVW